MVLDTSVFSRPERLAAVRATGLLDTPPDPEFDRYTRLAAHASGTQLAVLTLFDARRQFFKSTFGRTPPWLDKRELPVQATLCQHTVREGQSVFVDDTREDPRMRELQIVRNREALAYAGVPLRSSALEIIGTLAVLQDRPRNWDQDVRKDLEELAQLAERDIARRVGVLGSPEAVYTSLFEHSPQPMLVYDVATLRILSVNEAAVAQYGWTRARMLGMTMEQIRPPEEVERFHENLACAPQGLHRAGIRIHQRHDGTRMIVDVTAHPVRFDGQDARLILVEDVTVRKGREDHLHMLEKAVEHLTDFVMVTEATPLDEPGPRIVFLNPAFEHITGWRNEDAVGRSPRFLQGPKTSRAALDRIRKALEAHMPVHEELLNYGPDGEPFWVELDIVPVDNPAIGTQLFVANGHDVTQRRALEDRVLQANKMAAVGRLAGGVAHDFNNLLTTILGYVEVATGTLTDNDPARECLGHVRDAAQRAAALTAQLLAFGRRQILRPRVLDLNERVRSLEPLLRPLLGDDVELALDLDPEIGHIQCDPGQLEQVLVTLAVNAREAMPSGGRFELSTGDREDIGIDGQTRHFVRLSLADTGVGMDASTQERMFEPFFSTKQRGPSSGLSLASVYGIIEQSGGLIEVSSSLGQGTRVDLLLPRAGPDEPRTESRKPSLETVLMVEDEDAVRRVASEGLRRLGYRVLEAKDGREAFALLERAECVIDLLVTDVAMPGLGGPELAQRARKLWPHLPILFVSGHEGPQRKSWPCAAFLGKPFTLSSLAGRVRELLDERAA